MVISHHLSKHQYLPGGQMHLSEACGKLQNLAHFCDKLLENMVCGTASH
ncbi:hypothetical protein Y11_05951 [Yersinia enterocolitica subsp. palearctica Y11]|uniref:Uncharacterized protein n=1 Tax=Yersinia enterocolitica subsp. palearctica serotype O:3 (strain DSM 13030 / CIP 106945 / Y11) TaxID=930944 RepID=A0A0H3NRA1_YERE1|nr:hypothetical protein YEP1_02845 [Yersinia enterocolitica subsp. palearctica YE-P1]CBY27586.1 hypothetical protein Y11_05951 [Yersinia enterocolitica subsp. palearctica Y11]CCO68999.1 hypothetical protein D322_2125 [Yersinia enterocolitica IP 10393]